MPGAANQVCSTHKDLRYGRTEYQNIPIASFFSAEIHQNRLLTLGRKYFWFKFQGLVFFTCYP